MGLAIGQRYEDPLRRDPLGASSAGQPFPRSTPAERGLLLATVMLLPLENHVPNIGGLSIIFAMFLVLAAYVVINRMACLDRVWLHPVFVSAFLFLLIAAVLEYTSPLSMYRDLIRFALAICGAVMISCLCRDRAALRAGLTGYLCASLWLSLLLFLTSYGTLSMSAAGNFQDASELRADAFRDNPLQGNLNSMALMCSQGGVVALAFAMAHTTSSRLPYLGIAGFCILSTFLTMSRGGVLIVALASGVVIFAHGFRHLGKLLLIGLVLTGVLAAMPNVIWSRMSFTTEKQHGKVESRVWLYSTALERLPEYALAGVGAGNFWNKWGFERGFAKGSIGSVQVIGAHNTLLQVLIYWGVLGLAAILWFAWRVYKALPTSSGLDELSLALVGVLVTIGAWLLQSHNFYDKSLALGLGLLVGARQWIWPGGVVAAPVESARFSPLGRQETSRRPMTYR